MKGVVKLKITMKGMEKYTGLVGDIQFENGECDWIPVRTCDRIMAIMRCEIIEGDAKPYFERMKDAQSAELGIAENRRKKEEEVEKKLPESPVKEQKVSLQKYTKHSLERVADEAGISGLRLIADEFGIKEKSIRGLIEGILKAQG